MDVDKVASYQPNVQVSNTNTKNNTTDKDMFLKILAAELANPDPLNAQDNTQYISQLAQFSSLEQAQNLNVSMGKLLQSQQIDEGSALIGRKAEFNVGNGKYVGDTVRCVRVAEGDVYLECDNGNYKIDQVAGVGDIENDSKGGQSSEKPETV